MRRIEHFAVAAGTVAFLLLTCVAAPAVTLDQYLAMTPQDTVRDITAFCKGQTDSQTCLEKQAEALMAMSPTQVKGYPPTKIDGCLNRYPDMVRVKNCLIWDR